MKGVDDRRQAEVRFEPLDVVRWEVAAIDATEAADGYQVLDRFTRQLRDLLSQSEGRMLAVRVDVSGACRAHESLAAEPLKWTNELRAVARDVGLGNVWLEKIKLRTSPATVNDDSRLSEGPLGELIDYLYELRQRPDDLSWLAGELAELKRKLPAELQEGEDAIGLDNPAWLASLLENVQPILVSRLLARVGNS